MKSEVRPESYVAFFERLRSIPNRALLLDYDGTLAPFRRERDQALPYPQVPALLERIMDLGTRVALITGRPVRELLFLSGIHPHPEIWGCHGLERLRPDGRYETESLLPQQEAGLLRTADLLRSQGLENYMELKPGAIALHWRGFGKIETEVLRSKARQLLTPIGEELALRLVDFDGGLELRVRGQDKGKAVRAILMECSADAAVAYLGDDRTDEDAFRALQGRGLTVLVRDQFRPTLADIQLRPPEELVQFLRDWIEASGKEA